MGRTREDRSGSCRMGPFTCLTWCRMVLSGWGITGNSGQRSWPMEKQLAALLQKKKIAKLGVVAANVHNKAFQYGPNFSTLRDLPQIYKGAPVTDGTVFPAYDDATFVFPGEWDTDSRICLQGYPNRPCILLACVIDMETRENV